MSLEPAVSFPRADSERRRNERFCFAPADRPRLRLPDGTHPVLDASVQGLRIRHLLPERPQFGAHISGMLLFSDERAPHLVQGLIVRVQEGSVAIHCPPGVLPTEWGPGATPMS
ncbi:MAG TPA: hypothetical protein VJN95_13580 [Gemmatimonadales bacterium]|nr:hypothetical protein [Gemmatimonadales bacterium]